MSLRKFAKYRSRSLEGKNCPNSDSDLSSSSSSSESSVERRRKRKHKSYQEKDSKKPKEDPKHKPKRKKNYNDSSESLSSSDSEKFDKRKKKSKHKQNKDKKKKKKKKKEKKMKKSKRSKHDKIKKESCRETVELKETNSVNMSPENTKEDSFQGPSLQEMEPQPKKRSMVPMTREEYEKQQSKIRRIVDPETGRHRLIKGDGEVLEEIVSYDRHKMINKMATHGDGVSFQAYLQKEKNL